MKKILIILIGLTLVCSAELIRTNEVVEDTVAGLQWQDTVANQSVQLTWEDSIVYCEALSLDGYDDWRLPNINELFSLVDHHKTEPAISEVFEHIAYKDNAYYWSSTSDVHYHPYNDGAYGYIIGFQVGLQLHADKSSEKYVRCVRSDRH